MQPASTASFFIFSYIFTLLSWYTHTHFLCSRPLSKVVVSNVRHPCSYHDRLGSPVEFCFSSAGFIIGCLSKKKNESGAICTVLVSTWIQLPQVSAEAGFSFFVGQLSYFLFRFFFFWFGVELSRSAPSSHSTCAVHLPLDRHYVRTRTLCFVPTWSVLPTSFIGKFWTKYEHKFVSIDLINVSSFTFNFVFYLLSWLSLCSNNLYLL